MAVLSEEMSLAARLPELLRQKTVLACCKTLASFSFFLQRKEERRLPEAAA